MADGMKWVKIGFFGTMVTLFGTLTAMSARMATTRVKPYEQVLIRSIICLLASPVLGGMGVGSLCRSKNLFWLAGRGIFGFLASMCYFEAVQRLPLLSVALLTRMHMLCGPALVRLLSNERVLVQQVIGYIVGTIGIQTGAPEDTWKATHPYSFGFNYLMAATLSTGLSMHCVYRLTKLKEDQAAVRLAFNLGGVLGGLAFCGLRPKVFVQPTPHELGYIAAGAAATCIMQLALSQLFKHGKQVETAPFLFLSCVFSVGGGYFLGDALPRDEEALSMCFIGLGVAFGYLGIFGHQGWEEEEYEKKEKEA